MEDTKIIEVLLKNDSDTFYKKGVCSKCGLDLLSTFYRLDVSGNIQGVCRKCFMDRVLRYNCENRIELDHPGKEKLYRHSLVEVVDDWFIIKGVEIDNVVAGVKNDDGCKPQVEGYPESLFTNSDTEIVLNHALEKVGVKKPREEMPERVIDQTAAEVL